MLRTRQEEILETRLEGLRRSLTTTDRVLSGREVILTFSRDEDATFPAYSTGDRITLELAKIPNLGSNSALVEILGLNYHELAHVRYGVHKGMLMIELLSSQRHPRFFEAYRALEEGRVETLFAAKYAKMKKYFAYPVIKYFVKDKNAWPTAFLFTHGRRYLPLKIRETFRNIFEQAYGGTGEFADIIDKYRLIPFDDRSRIQHGARLINDFAALLERYKVVPLTGHDSTGNDPHDTDTSKDFSDPETAQDAQQARQQAQEQDAKEDSGADGSGFKNPEEAEQEDAEDGESESDGGAGDTDDADEQNDEQSESGAQDSGGGPDQEAPDDQPGDGAAAGDSADADGSAVSGPQDGQAGDEEVSEGGAAGGLPGMAAASSGKQKPPPARNTPTSEELAKQRQDLADEMSEILETVLDDEDIQNDVENLKSAMEGEAGLSSSLNRREDRFDDGELEPVTEKMLAEADRLKDVLRQIWAMMEPGWAYGLAEGNRIDMQRAALAQSADDYDSIYADWQEGQQDNCGLEVVIVADESWSMTESVPLLPGESRMDQVSKATVVSRQIWELKYALQEVEAHVTVISFSDAAWTLYDRQDVVTTAGYVYLAPDGGTNPTYALVEAKRIFTASEMQNKLLVTISDGDWEHWPRINCPPILADMPGVMKVAAVIDTDGRNYNFSLADKFDVVRRTRGSVFEVVADAVTRIVEGNLNT